LPPSPPAPIRPQRNGKGKRKTVRAGLAALVMAYVLSQFYRAFLAVLAPALQADLGATAQDLAAASGLWFLAFALMQLPVGWALDRVGPGRTAAALLTVGAVGAALFAAAQGVAVLKPAMALIGIGCSPVLMASYVILTRSYPPAAFATLAGAIIGIGSLGNIGAALPLALAVGALGWRTAMVGLAGVTLAVAAAVALLVRDPPAQAGAAKGSLRDILRMSEVWPVLAMMAVCYAPAAGVRGLWIGPYMSEVQGADAALVGRATLVMALAMVAGSFAYGPMERVVGSRKRLVLGGNGTVLGLLVAFCLFPAPPPWVAVALFAGIGFFGASFAMVIAHGRAFFPPALMGRGVTLLNLAGIGAAGLLQMATGRLYAAAPADPASAPFVAVLALMAALLALGLVAYAFSTDRRD
jgi:sugar phosphate permease